MHFARMMRKSRFEMKWVYEKSAWEREKSSDQDDHLSTVRCPAVSCPRHVRCDYRPACSSALLF
jgi:hypothetical protein